MRDSVTLAFKNLASQLRRSLLTGLSIVLAMLIVVFLLTISETQKQQLQHELDALAANTQLTFYPRKDKASTSSIPTMYELDQKLAEWVPDIPYSTQFQRFSNTTLPPGKKTTPTPIIKLDWRSFQTHAYRIDKGRAFTPWDDHNAHFAIVGSEIGKKLAHSKQHSIFLDNIEYQVIGVLQHESNTSANQYTNKSIMIPIPTTSHLNEPVDNVTLKVHNDHVDDTKAFLIRQLEKSYQGIFWSARSSNEFLLKMYAHMQQFSMTLLCICVVSILTAAINLANSLYFSILERKQEIAIRLAVGAKPWHIRNMFLAEALTLCTISSVLGIVLAELLMFLFAIATHSPFLWLWQPPLLGLFLCTSIGFAASYIPARAATRIQPLDIIRSL